jgi:hypothetical protein
MSVSDGPNLGEMINALTGDTFDVAFRSFLRMIDVLLQCAVKSITLAAPPGSPANGDRYIVAASPTGAWAGQAKSIAVWTTDNPATPGGLWEFYAPKFGWLVPNLADALVYIYSGSVWAALSTGGSSTLAADTDVALTSPTNGQVLTYDTASSKWKNTTPSGGGTLAGDTDVAVTSPADGDLLTYVASASKWENKPAVIEPFLPCGFVPGTFAASQILLSVPVDRAVAFGANFSGAQATLETAATATTVFIINKVVAGTPTQIGTITFAASGTVGTWASTSGAIQNLATGNKFQIVAPSSPDATAAGFGFTATGTR